MGQPNRQSSGWARTTRGNGRENDENKIEFKGFPRQTENYADKRKIHKEFKVGDRMSLKVKAKRSSLKLGNCSKLAAH
jgi:hypothetical protein